MQECKHVVPYSVQVKAPLEFLSVLETVRHLDGIESSESRNFFNTDEDASSKDRLK